ncbi:hypothetical protein FSP39_005794 [Pinctada imbricata]|uniref:C2H2-type domain-containing protein n=1 Tax=Pinctada imbricata TaxID=66713 RepID=A0AA88YHR3_PINIB|nr:hypothetical protein FSP39_005794 [Pinctada imbricata]
MGISRVGDIIAILSGLKLRINKMKSLISKETRSRINKYLDTQVVKNTTPSILKKKSKSAMSTKAASPKRVEQMNSASLLRDMLIEGRRIEKEGYGTEEGNHSNEELLEEHRDVDGATTDYDENMIDLHLEEVVTSEMEAARIEHMGAENTEAGQGHVMEATDNMGLGYFMEEIVTDTEPKKKDQVISLYSVDCIRSDMPSTSGMVTPQKKRVRKKRERHFDIMISQSKEAEDLRYDIGRSLLSLKNSRVNSEGGEPPKRILGVNYKKRREAARLKHRSKLPVIWSSTRTHDDNTISFRRRDPSPKTELERLSKIRSIRGISAKEAQSLLGRRETRNAVYSIATSPESSNDTIEHSYQKGKNKMAADSTYSPQESMASSPDCDDDSDNDMDGVILEMDGEEMEEDEEDSDYKTHMDLYSQSGRIFTLPTLDMKNLSKYQYRDIIPVLLKLTTKCDKIKPAWWPHGMIWCVKRNIYDQPNISLEALYKVVKSCYSYYNQTSSLLNEPTFESLEDLDQKQFKKTPHSPVSLYKANIKGVRPAEATGTPYQPPSDETVSTSTPDSGLEPMFKCTFCEDYFTKDDLKIHVKKHSGDKPYKCNYCDKSFSGKGPLQSHMRIHQRIQQFKCDICEATFEEKHRLNRHIRLHCKDVEYRCVFCDQVFEEDEHLQTHLRIHAGEKPYKCELCSKTFSYSSNYKVHMRLHTGDKPYKCTQCNARFRQLHGLKAHMTSHTGVKPFRCGLCDKQFQYKRSLQLHFKLHAAIFEIEQMHAQDIPGRCDNCKMLFTAKMDMLRRVRISSTSALPYGCRECNMSFLKAEELKTHFRIHAKESTLGCEKCKDLQE